PPAQGGRADGRVAVDHAAVEPQSAVFTVNSSAHRRTGGVDQYPADVVEADDRIGDCRAAAGGADAAASRRGPVAGDRAEGDNQGALVGNAAAADGGVAADGAVSQRGRAGVEHAAAEAGEAATEAAAGAGAAGGVAGDLAVGQRGRARKGVQHTA